MKNKVKPTATDHYFDSQYKNIPNTDISNIELVEVKCKSKSCSRTFKTIKKKSSGYCCVDCALLSGITPSSFRNLEDNNNFREEIGLDAIEVKREIDL